MGGEPMSITKTELHSIAKKFGDRNFNPRDVMKIMQMSPALPITWGFKSAVALTERDSRECFGFAFRVSGNLHKGWVLITLNFMDYYDVTLTPITLKKGYNTQKNISKTKENVFVGDLIKTIDSIVEDHNYSIV
jgi:hypothetical protein